MASPSNIVVTVRCVVGDPPRGRGVRIRVAGWLMRAGAWLAGTSVPPLLLKIGH